MRYRESCLEAQKRLEAAGVEEAALEARLLLEHVCGCERSELYLNPERELSAEEAKRFLELLGKRERRIPLQQLTGKAFFYGLEFAVNGDVLIPRSDTEILVEEAEKCLSGGENILDLCTGSGCILLSLLSRGKGLSGTGTDLSEKALAVAGENAKRLAPAAAFLQGDLFGALPESRKKSFDLIVSNPPYIASGEIPSLMPEVAEHEPLSALDGGEDGLAFYRRIAMEAGAWLKDGGRIFLEIGCDQAADVCALLEENGFAEVRVRKDYAQLDRVVCGRAEI
ncbi:MAG: peptide chain release factor N(5)-glutamine methyltransferase [Lachnospiraceae bacterium]|nr:peptide chain release factor N(5)-glutamine methyltransferase [Lachnospiraceae bacterium]